MAVQTSFGRDSAIILGMVAKIDPNIPILFADTGKHFIDTLKYKDTLEEHFGLTNVNVLQPAEALLAAQDPSGELHKTDADACCTIRKIIPMRDMLAQSNYDIVVTGRSKQQTTARDDLETLELHDDGLYRLNPLAHWTKEQRMDALQDVPQHTLDASYKSIGCSPIECTRPVGEGEDERDGRWANSKKTSCKLNDRRGGEQDYTI